MLAFRALRDVTVVTAMSTLVGLELWTNHIGPQTKEQAPHVALHLPIPVLVLRKLGHVLPADSLVYSRHGVSEMISSDRRYCSPGRRPLVHRVRD